MTTEIAARGRRLVKRSLRAEDLRDLLQVFSDFEMLRANFLAHSALNAFGRFSVSVACYDGVVVMFRVPAFERVVRVERREDVGNAYPFRTMILFDAVSARGAGDEIHAAEDVADVANRL